MSLYLVFHAWYRQSLPQSLSLSASDPNFVPKPEGLITEFDGTQELPAVVSKLNRRLKKHGQKVTVEELCTNIQWDRPSVRISVNEGEYIASFLEQIIAYNNASIRDQKFINLKEYIIDTSMMDCTGGGSIEPSLSRASLMDWHTGCTSSYYKVNDLIKSMINHFKFSDSCVILLFIYLWRLDTIILNSKNWKNILTTLMMLVVKWNEDWDWSSNTSDKHLENKAWASFGQMNILDLNYLELDMCKKIGWKFFVTKKQFEMAKTLIHMKYFES
jgi:hypothetical protein